MGFDALLDDISNTCKFAQVFFDINALDDPNALAHYKVNAALYMCYKHPPSPKLQSLLLYDQPFKFTGYFETTTMNDPKMTLNTTWVKVPHICSTSPRKYQPLSLYD